jgi:hypothetical protein
VIWLALIGGLIILVLASYAGWLHFRLWKLKKTQNAASVESFEPANNRVKVEKSIYLIADAFLDEKMTPTEACLRICALSAQLTESDIFRREHGVLFRVAEATAHIPILDEWQKLDKEEQRRLDRERKNVEIKYHEAVIESATRLKADFVVHR